MFECEIIFGLLVRELIPNIHKGEGENVQKQWSLFPAELVRRKLHSIGSR